MAALSPAMQDRLFFLGLGLGTCAVISLMRRVLVHYRDAAILPQSENKPQYITQEVEDSLKLSTLDKLLDSPNYCIQETASIIICERALHDESSIDAILYFITRPDYDTREKAVKTLTYMMNSSTIRLINKPATYAALVKSLEYSLTDYEHNPYDLEWDNWHLRDTVEQECLMLLVPLVDKFGVDSLVKTRFVERWLAKEPWGRDERERQINFLESLRTRNRLNELTLPLIRDLAGRRQLCKAKLLPQDFEWEIPGPRDVRMINGEGTAGEDFDAMFVEGRRRRDQSTEEEHIRRRHREAMVLNDGTRPLGRDDIIQRETVD
ncbi:Uncharacterized protein BP5553_06189 [Venustampulla echinocandica]|uniref:Cytoskeleton-associated protein n=1 Tax=Venustampulla echinocandica TaxID=2656787 RepID=A0A370TMU6_9HELO|nr:Uncharacterized protein BP5553_06189 [Venustampulla echinocandica]RDL36837.1 Uncharacterized protein BP5553_06189 [Venustampulla echinocandica]